MLCIDNEQRPSTLCFFLSVYTAPISARFLCIHFFVNVELNYIIAISRSEIHHIATHYLAAIYLSIFTRRDQPITQ